MKKILSVILFLIMALSLVACEAPKKDNDSAPTNSKKEEAVSSEEEPTSSKEEVAKTEDDCVEESNKLLNDGKLKAALTVLYNGQNEFKGSQKIQAAINSFFKRVKFAFTTNPGNCDAKSCFKDTIHEWESGLSSYNVGINFVDSQTKKRETIAKITIQYEDKMFFELDEMKILKQNGDKILFEIWSGPGRCSTFLYSVKTNKFTALAGCLDNFVFEDNLMVATTLSYAVGMKVDIMAYNWDGKQIYKKESTLSGCCSYKSGYVYFAKVKEDILKDVYTIYKMKVNGTNEQVIGTIESVSGNYMYFMNDKVVLEGIEYKEYSLYDLTPLS